MSNHTVNFHPNLNPQQVQDLVAAIRLLQGVMSVQPNDANSPASDGLLNMDFSVNTAPAPPPNTGFNPQFNANENTARASNSQDPANQAEEQKRIIAQIIKWGVHQNKISMEQLQSSSPEGTIEMAKKLIEMMPNDIREKILKS